MACLSAKSVTGVAAWWWLCGQRVGAAGDGVAGCGGRAGSVLVPREAVVGTACGMSVPPFQQRGSGRSGWGPCTDPLTQPACGTGRRLGSVRPWPRALPAPKRQGQAQAQAQEWSEPLAPHGPAPGEGSWLLFLHETSKSLRSPVSRTPVQHRTAQEPHPQQGRFPSSPRGEARLAPSALGGLFWPGLWQGSQPWRPPPLPSPVPLCPVSLLPPPQYFTSGFFPETVTPQVLAPHTYLLSHVSHTGPEPLRGPALLGAGCADRGAQSWPLAPGVGGLLGAIGKRRGL